MKNEPIKKQAAGALATVQFEEDAAQGLGQLGQQDLALPFLKILGQLSPEVNKRDGKYVQGAEPGMIFNSVTGELYDGEKGIEVIPAYYSLKFVEWKDVHPSTSDILSKTTRGSDFKDRLPNGNYVEKTGNHFVIIKGDSPSTALIAMKSTNLKISRKWNSMIASIRMKGKNGLFTPASFSHVYNLRTVQQQNDKGTWFGWEVSKLRQLDPSTEADIYSQAKTFSESVSKGDVEVKYNDGKETKDSII
jgi:hypothetical protein